MDFFEKIGDAANKTYRYTAEKTSKIAKETKLKMQINEYKGEIKDLYIEIGENVYEKYVKDEELDTSNLQAKCEMIEDFSNKIVECKDEILKLKEKRQCRNCYEEIELSANYCPNCGAEQERVEAEEEKIKEEQTKEAEEKAESINNQEKQDEEGNEE